MSQLNLCVSKSETVRASTGRNALFYQCVGERIGFGTSFAFVGVIHGSMQIRLKHRHKGNEMGDASVFVPSESFDEIREQWAILVQRSWLRQEHLVLWTAKPNKEVNVFENSFRLRTIVCSPLK